MICEEHVKRRGRTGMQTALWEANLTERDRLEDLDILLQGRIILKWVINGMGGRGMAQDMDKWSAN
jgi:hypothetical protein